MEEILLPSTNPSDGRLFRELMDRFTVLAEACARFSQEVYRKAGTPVDSFTEETIRRNLEIARVVFGRQSLETIAVIYMHKSVGFEPLKRALGPVRAAFLKAKLRHLEAGGYIQRDDAAKGADEARYSLTHKGQMIARLGEPVFLYLRLADGWRHPVAPSETTAPANEEKPAELPQAP